MGSSDDQARKDLKKGRAAALSELERIYEGPLKGLGIAPEFFARLAAPNLKDTPLGRGVDLQQELITAALGGLTGAPSQAGAIPEDLRSAVLESAGGAQAARGTYGSGAANLSLANRFAGISEQLRQSRIQSALQVLGGTSAQGSVFPDASEFLQLGAQRANLAAGVHTGTAQSLASASLQAQQQQAQLYSSIGSSLLGIGLAPVTGGLSLSLLGMGANALFGGGGAGGGLLPPGAYDESRDPFRYRGE